MERKLYRRSLAYTITGIVTFTFMIVVGAWGMVRGITELGCMVLMGIAFFVVSVVYGLFDTRPRVILDSQGISAREWGGFKILWSDIKDVKVISMPRAGNSIALELHNREEYIERLSQDEFFARKMSKWFTKAEFSFLSNSLEGSTNQIYQEIKSRINQNSAAEIPHKVDRQ